MRPPSFAVNLSTIIDINTISLSLLLSQYHTEYLFSDYNLFPAVVISAPWYPSAAQMLRAHNIIYS